MPGNGLIPARGNWETRWFETASAATFRKGSAVQLDDAYRLGEYASTDSGVLGIALSDSVNSTPMGGVNKVAVALPAPNCTAYSDVTTGIAQSDLSIGKKVCLYKQGNVASYASTVIGHASRHSALLTVVGPIDSVNSRVEVAFNMENVGWYSTSSTTYAS